MWEITKGGEGEQDDHGFRSLAAGAKGEVLTPVHETNEGPCRSCSAKRGSHRTSGLHLRVISPLGEQIKHSHRYIASA